MCEELKRTLREEALDDMGCEEEIKDQVSNLLCCCLKLLNDHNATRKLTHMLVTCMGEEGKNIAILAPLPERNVL
jgi:hypothetical protein